MDVGTYCLSRTRYLTGEEPTEIKAFSSVIDRDGRFTQVEETLSWTMELPNGALASCICTYGSMILGISHGRLHPAE